jgi:hypothetical protein
MTKNWYWGVHGTGNGDWSMDGSIDLANNELPWVKFQENASIDINAGDTATIKINKGKMPNWSSVLKVGRNTLALIDDSAFLNWNHPDKVKFWGVITKMNPKHKEFLTIKADSILTILNKMAINDNFNTVSTNPNDGKTFQGSTCQNLMSNIGRAAMNVAIPPAGQRPANIMGNFDGGTTGTTFTHVAKLIDFPTYGATLAEWRDRLSPNGNEFRFPARFYSADMNKIVLDMKIGDDTAAGAHLNESEVVTINIETVDEYNKMVEMSVVYDLNGVATRWVGSSSSGDETLGTGSDVTTKTNNSTGLPRLDAFFNPGVELTAAEMQAQLSAHLNASASFAEMTYSVEEDKDAKWRNHLGKTINFVGTGEFADFSAVVRLVNVNFNASTDSVTLGLMAKQPRYPVLPKDRPRGDLGIKTNAPINPPKAPNVKKGKDPIITGDDWDTGGALGQDTPTDLTLNLNAYGEEASSCFGRGFWSAGGGVEGHTLIADDAAGRFLGMSYAHRATMWDEKADGRGSLPTLLVTHSMRAARRPTNFENWNRPSNTQLGIEGTDGTIMVLPWATVSADALPGTLDGYTLKREIFNLTLSLYGAVNARTAMVTFHQLQLFEGSSDNKIKSKDFSYKVALDGNLDPTGSVVAVDDSIYRGNAVYDADWTFYAYGNQIGFDTSGDIEKTVILTPRAYPKDQNVPKPGGTGYDNNYWASINQGAYATWNIAMVKNWTNSTLETSSGPGTIGKGYRQMTVLSIPWIDQSRTINNTFACTVLGGTVYASSMTAYGKATDKVDPSQSSYKFGEFLVAKSAFQTKPNKGLTNWEDLYSGNMLTTQSDNATMSPYLIFASSWRRNANEVALNEANQWSSTSTSIMVRNGVKAVRKVTNMLMPNYSYLRTFSLGSSQINNDPWTDFYGFQIGTNWNGNAGTYAWHAWGPLNSGIQDASLSNKSLRCYNFTVSINAVYNGEVRWSWEI